MVEPQSSEELVRNAQAGDRTACGRLIERYSARLTALVETRLGPSLRGSIEVEDVVQETFRRALEGLERFVWTGEDAVMRWLGGIAENLLRNTARAASRRPPAQPLLEIPAHPTSPSRNVRREERFERLEKALESLPEDYREVLRLCRIEGLKTAEVAERMGRSAAAVRQLIVRALRRLKEAFGDTASLTLPERRIEAGERDV